MPEKKIKVLVTDDSLTTRNFLVKMLSMDPDIEVIGTASNGYEAIAFIKKIKPDVVTMDINMPLMDGFEATLRIMQELPVPIVIVSAEYSSSETNKKFRALEAGAVAILPLPVGFGHPDFESFKAHFVSTVKLMSEVKLIRRWNRTPVLINQDTQSESFLKVEGEKDSGSKIHIIAIGASSGGPMVVKEILDHIPTNLTIPIIIVQHIDSEFTQGYADWLNISASVKVVIAQDGEQMESGKAYIAPEIII